MLVLENADFISEPVKHVRWQTLYVREMHEINNKTILINTSGKKTYGKNNNISEERRKKPIIPS